MIRKLKFMIIIIPILGLMTSISGSPATANVLNVNYSITPNQGTYSLTFFPLSISIVQGESVNISVKLTLDGLNVNNSFFEIVDQQNEIIVDIAENQIYQGNGNYTLLLTENSTINIQPNIYNAKLIAYHNENEIVENFTFTITSIDSTAPVLLVINPENFTSFTESVFKLTLEGTDDIFWKDVSIDIGDLNIYYLANQENEDIDLPDLKYNSTYVFLDLWINLPNFEDINSSDFTITLRDRGFNSDIFSFQLEGDYVKPEIIWISHNNDDLITSRNVTLSWIINDDSVISVQIFKLNGKIFKPSGQNLEISKRSINFLLPVPEGDGQILIFSLFVKDVFENSNEVTLRIIYDPQGDEKEDNFASISFDKDFATNLLYGSIFVILVVLTIILVPRLKKIKADELSKSFIKMLNDPPIIDFDNFSLPEGVKEEIIEIVNEIITTEVGKDEAKFFLNNIKTKFEYIIYKYPDNKEILILIETNYFNWLNNLNRRLKQ